MDMQNRGIRFPPWAAFFKESGRFNVFSDRDAGAPAPADAIRDAIETNLRNKREQFNDD
jgi:hypothetical protein